MKISSSPAAALALALAASACSKEKAPTTGSLHGAVRLEDATDHSGTFVILSNRLALTPADGSFSFGDVPPGDVVVRAVRDGYVTQEQHATVAVGADVEIAITLHRPVAPDRPPVLASIAASPSELAIGGTAALVAVATDPDGDPLTYEWTVDGDFAVTADATAGRATLTAPRAPGAVATVTLVVDDGRGGAVTAKIPVSTAANRPPVVSSLLAAPAQAAPGATLSVEASATDPDGDALSYEWTASPGWLVSGSGATATVTAPAAFGQLGTISVTVRDVSGGQTTASVAVATAADRAPVVAAVVATPPVVAKGGTIAVVASASDPDGDPLSFTFVAPAGWTLSSAANVATVVAPAVPSAVGVIEVVVTDPSGLAARGAIAVATAGNGAPAIGSIVAAPAIVSKGGTIALAASAADPDGDALAFAWSAPAGWTLSASGATAALAAPAAPGQAAIVDLVVTDPSGAQARGSVAVATAANQPPVLSSVVATPPSAPRGGTIALEASASDPDGDTVSYAWSASEGWTLTASGATAAVVAPSTPGATGTVTVEVSDGLGGTASQRVVVTTAANRPPAIQTVTATPPAIAKGGTIALAVSASDDDGDALQYAWTAPAGWTLAASGATATVVAPETPGAADTVSVQVSDGQGGVATGSVTVSTRPNATPAIATLTATPNPVAKGGTVALVASASDPDGDALTYAWSVGAGWSISGSGASVTLTAPALYDAPATVTLVVSDPWGGSVSGTAPVATRPDRAPEITTTPPPNVPTAGRARTGAAWSYSAAATDPDGDAVTWSLAGAPPTASIDAATGLVTYAPTRKEKSYAFSVNASDGLLTATQELEGSVDPFALRSTTPAAGPYGWDGMRVVADLDGDGVPDVAGASSNGDLYVTLGTSGGIGGQRGFAVGASGFYPINCHALDAADLDGDGDVDVVVACQGGATYDASTGSYVYSYSPTVVTYLNDGTGNLTRSAITQYAALYAPYLPWGIRLADLNGDGRPDLVVAYDFRYVVSFLNDGTGAMGGRSYRDYGTTASVYSRAGRVAVGSFTASAAPAVAVASWSYDATVSRNVGALRLIATDGTGTLLSTGELSARDSGTDADHCFQALAAADLDGNGTTDFAVYDACAQRIDTIKNDGAGGLTLVPGPSTCISYPYWAFEAVDLDGDGKPDLASASCATSALYSQVTIAFGDGAGGFDELLPVTLAAQYYGYPILSIRAADWNGDGLVDLYATTSFPQTIIAY